MKVIRVVLLAAGTTLAINPRAHGDVGWQLSFAAVIGILYWSARLGSILGGGVPRGSARRALIEGVAVTVAATVATAPLMAHHFEQFSPVALPANVLALPAVAPAMWLGMRLFALWVNMIQNYWTHDRRFGYRRYDDERDNAMNIGEWLPVTATFSACLQNNHHHFPGFLRLSHHESEYDFGFEVVKGLREGDKVILPS